MINLYKNNDLEILIPETYEEALNNNPWCSQRKDSYIHHTENLNQTLIRFIFSGGYLLSLGVNKKDLTKGQWLDNVKNELEQSTLIYLHNLGGDVFNTSKMKEIATKKGNKNLENMANRIESLPKDAKDLILGLF